MGSDVELPRVVHMPPSRARSAWIRTGCSTDGRPQPREAAHASVWVPLDAQMWPPHGQGEVRIASSHKARTAVAQLRFVDSTLPRTEPLADNGGRVAGNDCVRGDVLDNHCASRDYRASTNGDTGQHRRPIADPAIRPNPYGKCRTRAIDGLVADPRSITHRHTHRPEPVIASAHQAHVVAEDRPAPTLPLTSSVQRFPM